MLPECQLLEAPGRHPCELAEYELMPMIERGLWVELVDITSDAELNERYDGRIPVLRRLDTGAELDWPFESAQLAAFLA